MAWEGARTVLCVNPLRRPGAGGRGYRQETRRTRGGRSLSSLSSTVPRLWQGAGRAVGPIAHRALALGGSLKGRWPSPVLYLATITPKRDRGARLSCA